MSKSRSPFGPPPHLNAEPHRRVMEALKTMSNEEFMAVLVKAGTRTADGQLTEHYRSDPSEK